MTIRFDCQFCGKTLKADDSKAGKKVNCPSCEGTLTIPQVDGAEAVGESINPPARESDRPPEVPARGRKIPCAVCDELISPYESRCPWCNTEMKEIKKRRVVYPTAGPMQRLWGAIIDLAAMVVFFAPGACLLIAGAMGAEGQRDEPPLMIVLGILGIATGGFVCFIIQFYLLMQHSQSIGKYFAKMRIMDYETDTPADLVKSFLLRSVVNKLIGCFTCAPLYFILDSAFVFGEEHRCLHDQIAGTYVADISDT